MAADLISRAGQQRLAEIPLYRFGEPEDMAGPIVFLRSDASTCITGQTLTVDGGVINGQARPEVS